MKILSSITDNEDIASKKYVDDNSGGGSGAVWGSITGTLSNQTDLNTALGGKQAKFWEGTLSQYNAIVTKDPDTYYAITDDADMTVYQPLLVSGTNIKTINNESILGSGNINIQGGGGSSTDVQVNGTSITSNGVANLVTEGTYNATTNKIATMSDISKGYDASWVENQNGTVSDFNTLWDLIENGNTDIYCYREDQYDGGILFNITNEQLNVTASSVPSK